jgi:hypothetical protein
MVSYNNQFRNDALLEMKDAGVIAASAAAQVDSSDKVFDTGGGFFEGNVVIDITSIEIASTNEIYTIILEGSSSETFASVIVPLAVLLVGANAVIVGGSDVDSTVGRYVVPFRNERDEVVYQYLRLYTVVAGTIATGGGINYVGFLAPKQ